MTGTGGVRQLRPTATRELANPVRVAFEAPGGMELTVFEELGPAKIGTAGADQGST